MSLLQKTARQSASLASLWRNSSLAQVRTFSIGAYNFQKDSIKTAPGWSHDDATESEADVKADREPLPKNMEELQKESVENLHGSKSDQKHHNSATHAKGKAHDVDDHVDADKGA
ncbi:hypothetical protein BGZ52_008139 [Haplosporangium bisporale]|nr:hypothetical protein BGZ52_008139 [Haplosporangium bisporale]KAF9216614.1 hypothetical protein BGZ59_008880 [Podila verticillata]KAI9239489.1 MAG: hypothetical protein BYD32DRAFT_459719 [Podila humilis]KFH67708.1 hypothetical protein MVEG_06440 [Podila verticillata NRRL 6337]